MWFFRCLGRQFCSRKNSLGVVWIELSSVFDMTVTRAALAVLLFCVGACGEVGKDSSSTGATGGLATTGGDGAATGGRTGGAASSSGGGGLGGDPPVAGGMAGRTASGGLVIGATGGTGGELGLGGTGSVTAGGAPAGGTLMGGKTAGGALVAGGGTGGVTGGGGSAGEATGGRTIGGAASGGAATGGRVAGSCDNDVVWDEPSTSEPFANIATSDNRYRFSSGGWGWQGAGHTIALTPDCGFRVDEQSCSRTDELCSFPVIYVGTDEAGARTSGFTPTPVSALGVVSVCLAWFDAAPEPGEFYNVVVEVWLAADADATDPDRLLTIWLRDPPGLDPLEDFPVAAGTIIELLSWDTWFALDEENRYVVSYVSPTGAGEGQTYTFDLMGFIDDAVQHGYLQPTDYVVSIRAGMQIQSGGALASIDTFRVRFE